jgi:hypothetical protein
MSRRRPELIRRHAAVEKVVRKYQGKPCDFREADCIRMARTLLIALGHRPPKLPAYSSLLGARKALKAKGFDTVEALLDSLLPRIPMARLLPGDLLVVPGEDDGIDAVWMALGVNRAFGWHADAEGAVAIEPRQVKAAFRG